MFTRRRLLQGSAAMLGAGALGLPRLALTNEALLKHKLIVVFAVGGWDTTRCFTSPFDIPSVDIPDGTSLDEAFGIPFVHHDTRPKVRNFFERYGDITTRIDGVLVRSVNHKVCRRLILTGASRHGAPDWPSIVGAAAASEHALPSIVLSGPSSPGPLHRYSSIVGSSDQLQNLLSGKVFDYGDSEVRAPRETYLDMVDEVLAERVAGRLADASDPGVRRMLESMDDGLARAERLRSETQQVTFEGSLLSEQVRTAVSLLAAGVTRCVGTSRLGFDTHVLNENQDGAINSLFSSVIDLVELLGQTPDSDGGVLLDNTTVAVISEMGRAPYVNIRGGKDHWPYTSALLIGGRIRGGTTIGGYDSYLNGRPTDVATGAVDSAGVVMTPEHLGATLLSMSGIDPEPWLPGIAPITAALR
jgi:uncharacterized protein (DUF1501 family)